MKDTIINVARTFERTLTNNQGNFVTAQTITYEVRNSITDTLITSGTMTEQNEAYKFTFTFTVLEEFRIKFFTPINFANDLESGTVIEVPVNATDVTNLTTEINEVADEVWVSNVTGIGRELTAGTRDTEIDAILADTNEIQGKLPDNFIMGSGVSTNKDDEIDSIVTTLSTLIADIWAFATRTLTGIGTSGIASEANATTNTTNIITEIDANETKIDALPTAADIADAVWDEQLSDHLSAGSTGEALDNADAIADLSLIAEEVWTFNGTGIGRELTAGTRDTEIDSILADTNEIQGKLPDNFIMGSGVTTDKDDEIDAIKVKTDNLPVDPASETNVDANETKIDSIITTLSTILSDIWSFATRTLTGIGTSGIENKANATTNTTNIITEIDANETKIDSLPTASDIADAVWDEAIADHLSAGSTGEALQSADDSVDISLIAEEVWTFNATGIGRTLTQGTRDTEIDAIKAKTDNLPVDPASEANATTNTNNIIAEIDANEVKIDALSTQLTNAETNIISEIDANEVKIDALSTQLTNAETNIIAEIDANEVKIDNLQVDIDLLKEKIFSIAGLVHDNSEIVNQVYDSNGNLTSATVRNYANQTDLNAQVNVIREYTLTSTFNILNLNTFFKLERII